MPKYSVHVQGNGSTCWTDDYAAVDTIAEAQDFLRRFAEGCHAKGGIYGGDYIPGAWARVYAYDERDECCMSHGDYPLFALELGPRGGIVRVSV